MHQKSKSISFIEKMNVGEDINFIPKSKINEIRKFVKDNVILQSSSSLAVIEQAEALETLGLLEFYEGNWLLAEQYLQKSLYEFTAVDNRRNKRQFVSSLIVVRNFIICISKNYLKLMVIFLAIYMSFSYEWFI
jgi:hypothetical protein